MTSRTRRLFALLIGAGALFLGLAGCNGKSEPLNKQEQADFKGGPMPESARKIMQEKMQQAQKNMPPGTPAGPR